MADIDDPFLTPDPTQRPRPGAGRRGVQEPAFVRPTASRRVEVEPLPAPQRAQLGIGLNPLVQAASPILFLTGQLRSSPPAMDVTALRRTALDEIRGFEDHARACGVRDRIVTAARYVLCAGLDEAVQSTPWGLNSEWSEHSLLVALHREVSGGQKFFEMLEQIAPDPARHIDLLELMYLELALGFTGKYQQMDRGHESLAALQQELYRRIRGERGAPEAALSIRWRGLEDRRSRLIRYVPWWVVAAAALAILVGTFGVYYGRLAARAEPIQARLALVGVQDFTTAQPAPPMAGPTLKQLLRDEEARDTMTVTESGGRTVVTLLGGDLFESASATINPSYEPALQRLAEKLNQVKGRVLIEGHTDDRPLRSVRYRDNFQLSRERAVSVAAIMKRTLANPGSLTWQGDGDRHPLYSPASDPRNRRVEIIHIP